MDSFICEKLLTGFCKTYKVTFVFMHEILEKKSVVYNRTDIKKSKIVVAVSFYYGQWCGRNIVFNVGEIAFVDTLNLFQRRWDLVVIMG